MDADIEHYNGYVHPSSDWSMAWVQLVDQNYDTWAKSGWLYTGSIRNVIQYWKPIGGMAILTVDPPQASNYYGVEYLSLGRYDFWTAAGSAGITNVGGGTPNMGQAAGETHSLADQMPGGSLAINRLDFDYVYITPTSTSTGVPVPISGVNFTSGAWYGLNGSSTSSFEIWDTACPL